MIQADNNTASGTVNASFEFRFSAYKHMGIKSMLTLCATP
jgi:hypothetical protein